MSGKPPRPKSTEEILQEMEAMSKGIGTSSSDSSEEEPRKEGGGAFKSLLGFFVKVVPEEEEGTQTPSASNQTAPPRPASRPISPPIRTGPRVSDLVAGEAPPTFKTPKAGGGDLSQRPFEQIYKEAGITNPPCSVDELAQLMENPAVANQPLSVKIIAVNLTLSAKGIGPDIPVADAVRKDRALDGYQQMLDEKARQTEQRNLEKIQLITKDTEEYLKRRQAEMETLRAETAEARRQSLDFSLRREEEEKRMANLISPFLEGKPNPVTVGSQPVEGPQEG